MSQACQTVISTHVRKPFRQHSPNNNKRKHTHTHTFPIFCWIAGSLNWWSCAVEWQKGVFAFYWMFRVRYCIHVSAWEQRIWWGKKEQSASVITLQKQLFAFHLSKIAFFFPDCVVQKLHPKTILFSSELLLHSAQHVVLVKKSLCSHLV